MANEISISVENRKLICTVNKELAGGGANSVQCVFSFDAEWDGLTKSAIFQTVSTKESGKTVQTIPVILEGDCCMMPAEVMAAVEYVKIGLAGTRDGNVILPTTFCQVPLAPGCYTGAFLMGRVTEF